MALDLLDRRLLFVTGKGGVGKSTVAAGLALLAADRGKRTLVCEVDAKGGLATFFESSHTGFAPTEVQPHLFAMSMDTEESLKEYLSLQLKIPLLARIGPLARTFDFVANAAPGVKEILTVGKLAWEVVEDHYDLVVVDSVASGHIVGQLAAPKGINELVSVGMVRNQTAWMLEVLEDPARTGVVVVAAPEEMPVNETIELSQRLRAETDVDLAAVIVNRVLPELFGRGEEERFDALRTPARTKALGKAVNGDVGPIFDAAELAVTLRRTRAGHLATLRAGLKGLSGPPPTKEAARAGEHGVVGSEAQPRSGSGYDGQGGAEGRGVDLMYLPEIFARSAGLRFTRQVAEALDEELG